MFRPCAANSTQQQSLRLNSRLAPRHASISIGYLWANRKHFNDVKHSRHAFSAQIGGHSRQLPALCWGGKHDKHVTRPMRWTIDGPDEMTGRSTLSRAIERYGVRLEP